MSILSNTLIRHFIQLMQAPQQKGTKSGIEMTTEGHDLPWLGFEVSCGLRNKAQEPHTAGVATTHSYLSGALKNKIFMH